MSAFLRFRLLFPLLLIGLVPRPAPADSWNNPHPWRREALIEGRAFEYDEKSFLQRFSYRGLSDEPGPLEDGFRGTVGSLTSKRAYSEMRFRKTLPFDRGRRGFVLAMHRGEDFDGYYDRQLVGFYQQLGKDWTLAVRGDVQGDKAESDVWFQTRWRPGDQLFEFAAIVPDAYFNDKTALGAEYTQQPPTLFGRTRLVWTPAFTAELSVNHSPEVEVIDRRIQLRAGGKKTRAEARIDWHGADWHLRLVGRGEYTERDFDFYGSGAPGQRDFRRIFHRTGLMVTYAAHRLEPTLGLQHFYLDEEGYFGTASGTLGQVHHSEPMLVGSLRLETGERQYLRPELLLSQPELTQTVDSERWRDRDTDAWRGKLSVPWRYTVNRADGAVITISPSFELHEPGFGGGNVQLHWPL